MKSFASAMILIVAAGWPSKPAGGYRQVRKSWRGMVVGVRGGLGVMLGIYGCLLVFHPKFGVGNREASLSVHALMRLLGVQAMGRNSIGAIALLVCSLVIAALIVHERCRLGNVRWHVCTWLSIPHAGGPFPTPPN